MNIIDKAQLGIVKAEMAYMNMSPLKRRLLLIAGVVAATQLACVLPALFQSIAHPTATVAPALLDPTHLINATPTPMADHITLGQPVCNIENFGPLGAHSQGVDFSAAIPEGQQMTLNCGGVIQPATLHYDESSFPTTTFIMGPDSGDTLPRMAEIGNTLRQVPADPRLTNCDIEAFAAPMGNGGPDFQTTVDISAGNHFVAPIVTAGNSTSILEADRMTTPLGFSIHPEFAAGAIQNGDPYTEGHLSWALFKWVADAAQRVTLNFSGIIKPSPRCPIYIDQQP